MNSGDGGLRKVTQNIPSEPPAPIMPKSVMKKLKILDLDVLEIARQLTLKESNLFLKIRPSEILARAKESSETDNIKAIISTTNKVGLDLYVPLRTLMYGNCRSPSGSRTLSSAKMMHAREL
jgi:hypothetical protein